MNDMPVTLHNWIEENIHPKELANRFLMDADVLRLNDDFALQIKAIKKSLFTKLIFSKKKAFNSSMQLVSTSDRIHYYLRRLAPSWNRSGSSSKIKCIYITGLNSLEALLDDIYRLAPNLYGKIPITKNSLSVILMGLKTKYNLFSKWLEGYSIENDLMAVVQGGLKQSIYKKGINHANVDYCHFLMRIIMQTDYLDTKSLKRLLIINGFNLPSFYYYCITKYQHSFENAPGLHEQMEMLIIEQDNLVRLPRIKKVNMLSEMEAIDVQLKCFLAEKKQHTSQMLELKRALIKDESLEKSISRLRVSLPVAQFALFIRVQIEKGILIKENIGELFTFFAKHFHTPQTMFISADSLRKKSTDVEFGTAQKLKGHLISMLNWLNENYNLSNYKGS